jgi:peptidyl-tRNA hydrolase
MSSTGSTELDINYAALVSINEQQSAGDWIPSALPPLIPRSNSNVSSPFGKHNAQNQPGNENMLQRNSPNGSKFGGNAAVSIGNGPHRVLVPSKSQKNIVTGVLPVAQSYPHNQHNLPQATPLSYDSLSVLNAASLPMAIIQQHHNEGNNVEIDGYDDGECNDGSLSSRPITQSSKLLLIVRQDLNLTPGQVTQQCIQATVRASRALNEYDSMAVRRWIRDGDQVIVAAVLGEDELNSIVHHASELCLPVLTLLAHDSADMPVAIAALGPAPSGVLAEIGGNLPQLS